MVERENLAEGVTNSTRALIIGAGIAGMQAALDIANSGYEVVMVDKLPSIGGRMHVIWMKKSSVSIR